MSMIRESASSAKILHTPDAPPAHQFPMQEIGPAWEAKQIHNTSENVAMKDPRQNKNDTIPAEEERVEKPQGNMMIQTSWSPKHTHQAPLLQGVDRTPHEEISGIYTNTPNRISVYGGQVSAELKSVGASSVGSMGESLNLADVTAAMRKAIGMTTSRTSGSDSRDGFDLKNCERGEGPVFQLCVSEEVKERKAIRAHTHFDAPRTQIPASDEPPALVSTGIAAGNLKDESGEAKLILHHLDEEYRQEKCPLIALEGSLVKQKSRPRKSRHEDFVGAVREALRHIPLPTGGGLGPSGGSISITGSTQHGGNQQGEQEAISGSTGDGERATDTKTNVTGSSGGNIRVVAAAEASGAANTTLVSDLASTCATPVTTKSGEEHWVRYTSPEGYPYLHNPWTGDSKWVVFAGNGNPEGAISLQNADYTVGVKRDDELVTESLGEQEDAVGGDVSDAGAKASIHGVGGISGSTAPSTAGMYDADARNSTGETALHMAAAQQSLEGLSLLIAGGADVNAIDSCGRTPLHVACENPERNDSNPSRQRQCVEALLSAGAWEDARDTAGQTALHLASKVGVLHACEALVLAGARGEADDFGNTPLHLAAAQGHVEIMKLLILRNRGSTIASPSSIGQEVELLSRCKSSGGSDKSPAIAEWAKPDGEDQTPTSTRHLSEGQHQHKDYTKDDRFAKWTKYETEDGYTYYQNDTSGKSSWNPPMVSEPSGSIRQPDNRAPEIEWRGEINSTETIIRHDGSHSETAGLQKGTQDHDDRVMNLRELEVNAYRVDRTPNCEGEGSLGTRSGRQPPNVLRRRDEYHDGASGNHSGGAEPQEYASTVGPKVFPRKNSRESEEDRLNTWNQLTEDISGSSLARKSMDRDGRTMVDARSANRREFVHRDGPAPHRRSSHNVEKRNCLSRRRKEKNRDYWPETLAPEDYEEAVEAISSGDGNTSGVPSRAVLSRALFEACTASQSDDALAILYLLKSRGPGGANVLDRAKRTPLHHACRRDDIAMVRLLLQEGANPTPKDSQGHTPLIVAAATGSTECLRHLLEIGVDPNSCNAAGETAMHFAVWHGNLDCAKSLVENGGRLGQRNKAGFTPKEGVLSAGPVFNRGRPSKALRQTLEYVERIEEAPAASQTFSTGPCSHNWVRDDLHGGGKLFRSDGGEHSGSLHGENKHARYRDSYFDANRVGTERSQRHDDQNQFGLIESNGTNCAGTTVSVEDSTSSQHQITGAYGRGEAQREHGRRGTQRMSDDGEIRRDNAASPENNSKTLHRALNSGSMLVRDRTAMNPSRHSGLIDHNDGYILDNGSANTDQFMAQSSSAQCLKYAEHLKIQDIGPALRQKNGYEQHKYDVARARHQAMPCNGYRNVPRLEFDQNERQVDRATNEMRGRHDSTGESHVWHPSDLAGSTKTSERDRATEASPSSKLIAGTGGGVWVAVARTMGSILGDANIGGGGGNGKTFCRDNDPLVGDIDPCRGRPPTDDELRHLFPSHKSVDPYRDAARNHEHDANITTEAGGDEHTADDSDIPSEGDNVPFEPMKPPPDVLAAMRQTRRRSITPPPEVTAALEKARAEKSRTARVCRNSLGENDASATSAYSRGRIL